ncbi:hypothetical protein VaNZ11_003093 [Volvox africanus]|uniref:Galactose oxidase-like Early set domain-containing protein n=1 Tax=Volvox africanus TaxID=51714 RepID=A0ABQ5RTK9_9CHLO|nr:hypothetical protein VaNZ11_003093 [Volvox africanus]
MMTMHRYQQYRNRTGHAVVVRCCSHHYRHHYKSPRSTRIIASAVMKMPLLLLMATLLFSFSAPSTEAAASPTTPVTIITSAAIGNSKESSGGADISTSSSSGNSPPSDSNVRELLNTDLLSGSSSHNPAAADYLMDDLESSVTASLRFDGVRVADRMLQQIIAAAEQQAKQQQQQQVQQQQVQPSPQQQPQQLPVQQPQVQPVQHPQVQPVQQPQQLPVQQPQVQPVQQPQQLPVKQPQQQPVQQPQQLPVQQPQVQPVQQPQQQPVQQPHVQPVQQPHVQPVQQPQVQPVQQPHVQPVQQPHVQPVQQLQGQPVQQPQQLPVQQPQGQPVQQPQQQPVQQPQVQPVQQPHVQPVQQPQVQPVQQPQQLPVQQPQVQPVQQPQVQPVQHPQVLPVQQPQGQPVQQPQGQPVKQPQQQPVQQPQVQPVQQPQQQPVQQPHVQPVQQPQVQPVQQPQVQPVQQPQVQPVQQPQVQPVQQPQVQPVQQPQVQPVQQPQVQPVQQPQVQPVQQPQQQPVQQPQQQWQRQQRWQNETQQELARRQPLIAATFEQAPINAPVISIALTHIPTAGPRSRKYFAYFRAYTATQTQSAGTFDLNTRQAELLTTKYDQFCHGPIVLPDGRTALFGGFEDRRNAIQLDGRRAIAIHNDATKRLEYPGRLVFNRWYPTPCMTADNKVLIVGGTAIPDQGPQIPAAEIWDPAKPAETPAALPLPPTFKQYAWNNWYPFICLLPNGEILWWGDRGGSITNSNWKEIYKFPDLPNNTFPYRTMYWFTASIVLNALKPDPRTGEYREFSMTIFGGAPPDVKPNSPASPLSARLDMYYCKTGICDRGWVIEDMLGQRRVMPTTTVIPNGKVLVHGGGQAGYAGWKRGDRYLSILPAYQDLMYDPDAPTGNRYTLSATLGIIRMYHMASCLDLSGKVVTSGCETCGMTGADAGDLPANVSRSPDGDLDYRISFAVPTEIGPGVERPAIISAPEVITRGSVFTILYMGTVSGATLAAPCANTHSINMNQRVLFLNVASAVNGVARINAPPLSQPAAAHEGYYQLFLLGNQYPTGRTYSEGIWVYLEK